MYFRKSLQEKLGLPHGYQYIPSVHSFDAAMFESPPATPLLILKLINGSLT